MSKKTLALWNKDILHLLYRAGFLQPTSLQEKVIPIILKGKDLAFEAGEKTGKTAAFILPVLVKLNTNRAGIKALVLTSSFDNAKRISREFNKFNRFTSSKFEIILLGSERGSKAEFYNLSKSPDIVIGPTDRIIDHIRRGNLSLEYIKYLIIYSTDEVKNEGFDPDIHFIATKLPVKKQTILISNAKLNDIDSLMPVLRHPVIINKTDWENRHNKCKFNYLIVSQNEEEKIRLLVRILLYKNINSLLLLCNNDNLITNIEKNIKRSGLKSKKINNTISVEKQHRIIKDFNIHKFPVCIINLNEIINHKYIFPEYVMHFNLPVFNNSFFDYLKLNSFNARKIILFITEAQYSELQKYKEIKKVEMKKERSPSDEDVIKGMVEKIIKRIREEENPDALNKYKKLLKKKIPLFLRSYFMAYLFKEMHEKQIGKRPESTTKLFVSVGKNRKVFPSDLINLFSSTLRIKKSMIKDIKILDNYSFIEISSRYASKAIQKISGLELKGRRIKVNYAKKKNKNT